MGEAQRCAVKATLVVMHDAALLPGVVLRSNYLAVCSVLTVTAALQQYHIKPAAQRVLQQKETKMRQQKQQFRRVMHWVEQAKERWVACSLR